MNLPISWTVTPLSNLLDKIVGGGTPSKAVSANFMGAVPFMTVKDMKVRFVKDTVDHISEGAVASSSTVKIPPDTLVVATRMSLGKIVRPSVEVAINQDLKALFPSQGIDKTYLEYFWRSKSDLIQSKGTGTTVKGIRIEDIQNLETILAPENEQCRIAKKLDTILTRVDALNDRLDRITPLLKRFRQSVLAAATSGRLTEDWRIKAVGLTGAAALLKELTNDHIAQGGHERGNASEPTKEAHDLSSDKLPSGWQVGNLRDCCIPGRPITYGILKPGPELEIGVPYIRVADFPGNCLNPEKIKKTSPEIDLQYKRARLASGDLLLSIRGSVGRLIEIPANLEGANITQDTARLSISKRLSSRYIYFALLAPDTQRRMANAIRGVAVRGINIGDVRALQVPIPTKEEQTEIVRRVEILLAYADRLESRLQTARTAAERLTPALLAKAFRGELVPQDPNDEPAAELLRRLREARAAEVADKKVRGRKAQVV
jgi:type I restriction enzyme S subunit